MTVRRLLLAAYLIYSASALAQIEDTSGVLDKRMQTIAGTAAMNCGRVKVNEDRSQALQCARKAIKARKAFVVRFDHWGMDSFLSDGLAGNSAGDVYLIRFDSLGWSGSDVKDNGHNFVYQCPRPVRIRIFRWPKNGFVGISCKRRKRNSDDLDEQ